MGGLCMKVRLIQNDFQTTDVYLIEENKTLLITFAGNGDLYWVIQNKACGENVKYSSDYFDISKDNYEVYSLFEQLFSDIKNINICENKEFPLYVETDEEKKEYLENLELEKEMYRKSNMSHYNDLYDGIDTITWHSDETAYEVSNIVKIKKMDNIFRVEFSSQPHIDGYDEELNELGHMSIRFRNSGSRYAPFNILFMRMFNKLQEVDDVNDYGHQIHIEEYLYNNDKQKNIQKVKRINS